MSADLVLTLARLIAVFSAAIVVVLALRIPIRRAFGARIAYALWLLVPMATAAALMPARLVMIEPPAIVAAQITPASDVQQTDAVRAPASAPADEIMPPRDKLLPLLLALWALGFAGSFTLLVRAQQRFNTRLRAARREGGVHLAPARDIGPAVVGVFLPRIVVPADFVTRYTPQERELVLAHERAHISAGDVHVNAVAALLQCAFWFNPLVYIARSALRVDQELACDERVMARHAGSRRAYAEALLKTQLAARAVPLGCTWPALGARPLKLRIAALARAPMSAPRRLIGAGVCAFTAFALALTAWVAQPPRRAYADEIESQTSFFGRSAGARLVEALMDGDVATARRLIAAGADVNHWTPGDGTPLIMAARLNDRAIAAELLAAGADVNKPARGEGNALIVASRTGHLDLVRLFVEAGADVNAIVPSDETPLINAAWNNRLDVARYLVEHGADPNLSVVAPVVDGRQLRSPLIMARREGHGEMIALLQAAGARD